MKTSKIIALNRRLRVQRSFAVKALKQERSAFLDARRRVSDALKAQSILQNVAQSVQEQAHRQISTIVTRCLKTVFGEGAYKFKIEFERKRGKTDARLVFVRNKLELDPIDGCGGGVVDVAAFALRLACLVMKQPKRRRVLILDEPFRFLSEKKEYRSRMKELLETLAGEMDVQIIMVTHDSVLEAGEIVEIA